MHLGLVKEKSPNREGKDPATAVAGLKTLFHHYARTRLKTLFHYNPVAGL